MNKEEQDCMDDLVSAWNKFSLLPISHPDELNEFRHSFHNIQRLLLVRQLRRKSDQAQNT